MKEALPDVESGAPSRLRAPPLHSCEISDSAPVEPSGEGSETDTLCFRLSHSTGDLMPSFHDFEVPSITGEPIRLSQFEGQLCLVVNVASR